MATDLGQFIAAMREKAAGAGSPADCVTAVAPLLWELVGRASEILRQEHYQAHPDHYARNPLYVDEKGGLSLFAIVWSPGQWTPIHDHGTWGVVAVVDGILEERNYIRIDDRRSAHENIKLARGGISLLNSGSVTSFVPNPDHIHVTGVPAERNRAVSLHLYGRVMNDYYVYDREKGTRKLISVDFNQ